MRRLSGACAPLFVDVPKLEGAGESIERQLDFGLPIIVNTVKRNNSTIHGMVDDEEWLTVIIILQ